MKAAESIPTAPNSMPLIGHIVPLVRDPLAFLTSLSAHGDLVQIRLGTSRVIVLCDPELTRQVLHDDRTFDKGGPLIDRAREVLGNGLASCPHSEHRRQRRLAQPAFHPTRLAGYASAMVPCIDEVIGSWRDGQTVDVPAEMLKITSRGLMATLLSGAISASALGPLVDDGAAIIKGLYRRMLMLPPLDRLPTSGNRAYKRAHSRLSQTVEKFAAERRAGVDQGDLLSALLAARDPENNGQGLSDAEITDTIVTFIIASTETGAATLSWALHLLAEHPQIEHRLHAEVDSILGGRLPTYSDIPRLELTGRIIMETLRLYPPGWFFTRTVTTDTCLGGHNIPAGATMLYSAYLVHHREDMYANSATFDPDRWDPARSTQPPRHAFIPFGGGARKCIGDTFGMTEATLALAAMAARWRLTPLPSQNVRPPLGGVLWPRQLHMRVSTRPRSTSPTARQ
ncbi:cytochrome P450 [Streptomyces sp. NPDC055299]